MSDRNNHLNKELLDNKNSEVIEGMLKTLTGLSNDVTKKKVELEKVKTKVKEAKFNYNQEIKIYQQLNKDIILNEQKNSKYGNFNRNKTFIAPRTKEPKNDNKNDEDNIENMMKFFYLI